MNKYVFNGSSMYNKGSVDRLNGTIFYYGTVTSNNDELGANRIKVRVKGVDDNVSSENLPFSFPLIQKFVHIIPKVGETVLVFLPDMKNPNIDRMYVGPIISQPQNLFNDNELFSAKSSLDSGNKEALPAPFTIPENKGVYPNIKDVAIQGRKNSDIILREKTVLLRAGQQQTTDKGEIPKFNKINPSYIQIKHDVTLKSATNNTEPEIGGVVNIVSNKINLLTHKDGSPRFVLNDQTDMITDKEIQKIISEAHPLVFGDSLIEFLKTFIKAFTNHVHPYPGLKPQDLSSRSDIDKLLDYDLNSFLSKNIRIN